MLACYDFILAAESRAFCGEVAVVFALLGTRGKILHNYPVRHVCTALVYYLLVGPVGNSLRRLRRNVYGATRGWRNQATEAEYA